MENVNQENPSVQLTLTLSQAKVLADALDVYARLGLGQISVLSESFTRGRIPMNSPAQMNTYKLNNRIADLCATIQEELGFSRGGSYGIANDAVPIGAKTAYEIERVVRKAVAEYRDPEPEFRNTDYDGLLIRCTNEPEPICVVDNTKNRVKPSF